MVLGTKPETERIEGEIIRVGGVHVRVRVTGEGPPLLLVHGIGANLELWQPLIDQLDGYQIITLDNPGAGASTVPWPAWRMPRYAQVLDSVLEELGYDQVDVLGLSFGGMICQEFGYRYPERIRRFILAGTRAGVGSPLGSPISMSVMATPLRYYSPTYNAMVAPYLYGGKATAESRLIRQQMRARMKNPPSVPGYYAQLMTIAGWTALPYLHQIELPTLVLAGTHDFITPASGLRLIARRIPNAEYAEIEHGGHLFLMEKPEISARLIRDFLERDN